MNIYTTCAGCGELLHVTDNLDYHNGEPPCTPKRSRVHRLAEQWRDSVVDGNTELAERLHQQIDELDSRPPRLGAAAEQYALWGWPVFPLKARSKVPATKHGFKDATTDVDRIRAWWQRHPDHNIGLPTGIAFDVVDVDVPDGPRSLVTILEKTVDPATGRGLLPDAHGLCATASGGSHYYIEPRGGGNKASIMPGLDIRGAGGYVVAPPSTLGERGRSWSWAFPPSPTIKRAAVTA